MGSVCSDLSQNIRFVSRNCHNRLWHRPLESGNDYGRKDTGSLGLALTCWTRCQDGLSWRAETETLLRRTSAWNRCLMSKSSPAR